MPGAIAPETRAQRAAALRDLGDHLRRDFMASRIGHPAEVLVERVDDGIAHGTTRDYLARRGAGGRGEVGAVLRIEALEHDIMTS